MLVVATQRAAGAPIGAFVWRGSRAEAAQPVPPTAAGEEALALWIAQRIAPKNGAVREPRPAGSRAVAVTPSVSAFGAVRTRDVQGKSGGYGATFGGAGTRLAATATWQSWLAAGEISYVTYALSPVTADLPDGGSASGSGGATAGLALAGGWHRAGAGLSPFATAGASYEDHQANDLSASGSALGFFPSHQRLSLEVHGGASWARPFGVPLSSRRPSAWRRQPARTTT